jgi:periplasmic protein TonB
MRLWIAAAASVIGMAITAWGQPPHVRIPETQARSAVVSATAPEYPRLAKQMKLGGRVDVDTFIDTDGRVERTQVLTGNPLLSSAAVAALKKWSFTPFSADGKPIRVVATISFNFKM